MIPRNRWQGWTLVEKDGTIVVDAPFKEPFLWKLRKYAEETKEEGQRVVRCEVRVKKAIRDI